MSIFRKPVEIIQVSLKSDKNHWQFTHDLDEFLEGEIFQTVAEKIKTRVLCRLYSPHCLRIVLSV